MGFVTFSIFNDICRSNSDCTPSILVVSAPKENNLAPRKSFADSGIQRIKYDFNFNGLILSDDCAFKSGRCRPSIR